MKKFFIITSLLTVQWGLFAQNVGIGTITPLARLHVVDSNVIFSANGESHSAYLPILPAGRRLIWYPGRAAFRVGGVTGPQWDNDSIGGYSIAGGFNTKAKGNFSIAFGYSSEATAENSVALGSSAQANGQFSVALGPTSATGYGSFSAGFDSYATNTGSVAVGYELYAKAVGAATFGIYNDNSDNPSPGVSSPSDRIFQIGNGSGARSNAMTVLRNGNVGIGTVNPFGKLHIRVAPVGPALPYGDGFVLENNNSNYLTFLTGDTYESGVIFGLGSNNVGGNIIYNNAGTPKGFQFRTLNNTARMVIDSLGRVGIGTVAPKVALTFPGVAGDKISLWNDGSATHYGFGIQNGLLQVFTKTISDDVAFGYGASGTFTETMRIKGNGNLGIGTSSPAQRLQVNGNICATGTIGSCSDIRYKTNIAPLANALTSIVLLHGISYDWNSQEFPEMEFSNKRQIGFSAQEVEKFFPEIVATDDNGYKSVDYGKLTPLLVEALKEQQNEINDLKSEMMQMRKLIHKLSEHRSENK
jgi:hypothetical protein